MRVQMRFFLSTSVHGPIYGSSHAELIATEAAMSAPATGCPSDAHATKTAAHTAAITCKPPPSEGRSP